jgi:hypothetical protein
MTYHMMRCVAKLEIHFPTGVFLEARNMHWLPENASLLSHIYLEISSVESSALHMHDE